MSSSISNYPRAGFAILGVLSIIGGITKKRFSLVAGGTAALTLAYKLPAIVHSVKKRSRVHQLVNICRAYYLNKMKGQTLSAADSYYLSQLKTLLIDCRENGSLSQAAASLAMTLCGTNPLRACPMEEDQKMGFSGNPVFMIKDGSGEVKLVVKAFTAKDDFLEEVYGMTVLERLRLKTAQGVNFTDAGYYKEGPTEYFLLAMAPARGEHLIDAIEKASRDGQSVKNLAKCIQVFARGLKELHASREQMCYSLPGPFSSDMTRLFETNKRTLEEHGLKIDSKNHNNFYRLLDRVKRSQIRIGKVHFDATPKNVFCDSLNNRVIFIDCAGLAAGKIPLSYDFVLAATHLSWQLKMRSFAPDLEQELVSHFKNSYQKAGGTLPTEEELTLYTASICVDWFTSWYPHSNLEEGRLRTEELMKMVKNLKWAGRPVFEFSKAIK